VIWSHFYAAIDILPLPARGLTCGTDQTKSGAWTSPIDLPIALRVSFILVAIHCPSGHREAMSREEMDWHTRNGSGRGGFEHAGGRISVSEALNERLWFGPPDIMNRDQGSQFTSLPRQISLRRPVSVISMDGKGRYLIISSSNACGRTLKYECVSLCQSLGTADRRQRAGVRNLDGVLQSTTARTKPLAPTTGQWSTHYKSKQTQPDQPEQSVA